MRKFVPIAKFICLGSSIRTDYDRGKTGAVRSVFLEQLEPAQRRWVTQRPWRLRKVDNSPVGYGYFALEIRMCRSEDPERDVLIAQLLFSDNLHTP